VNVNNVWFLHKKNKNEGLCWGPVNVYRGCSTETLSNFGFGVVSETVWGILIPKLSALTDHLLLPDSKAREVIMKF